MTIRKKIDQGFTLIELLVVIAILATVSVPFIQTAQVKARMVRSGSDARNVLMALTSSSAENAGIYPEADDSANSAYSKLFPLHCDQESMFYVRSDRMFCDPESAPNEDGKGLAPGENHWAYVSGLTDGNKSNPPILADGFTDGIGHYDQYHPWDKLGRVIVGFMDGSMQTHPLTEGELTAPSGNGNLFEIPAIKDDDRVKVLNPERRRRSAD